jgi:hypothetical protein
MFQKAKFGVASALIFVAMATVPALVCISYLAQNTTTHGCCPQEKPQNAVLARCCVYSPAVTTPSVDTSASMIAPATFTATDPSTLVSAVDPVAVSHLDTSPPGCTSVLRI